MIKITLKTEDIKADRTSSGQLIDKVAMAIGTWTEEDLFENNIDYDREGDEYVIDHYDFEAAYIEQLNKTDMSEVKDQHPEDYAAWKKSGLKYGAWEALNMPDAFRQNLEAYKTEIIDLLGLNGPDDARYEILGVADFAEEIQDARDSFWKNLTHEWLYGDRSEPGLIRTFEKWLGDDVDVMYNDKTDTIGISIPEERAREFVNYNDKKITATRFKQDLCDQIADKMTCNADKEKAERAKRAEERKKTSEYQAKRAKVAEEAEEAERKSKLLAMKR